MSGGGATGGAMGSGGEGGFTKSENRVFRLQQLKSFKSLNILAMGTTGTGMIALIGAFASQLFKKQSEATKDITGKTPTEMAEDLIDKVNDVLEVGKAKKRNEQALDELSDAGFESADGLQQLADGSIVVRNEYGKIVEAFGGGMADAEKKVQNAGVNFANNMNALSAPLNALSSAIVASTNKILANSGAANFQPESGGPGINVPPPPPPRSNKKNLPGPFNRSDPFGLDKGGNSIF